MCIPLSRSWGEQRTQEEISQQTKETSDAIVKKWSTTGN